MKMIEKYQNLPQAEQGKNIKKEQNRKSRKTGESKVAIEWVRRRINEMVVG